MTVNARAEEDVEPDAILEKVAKASGANYHFHEQTQEYRDAPRGPVVRRYTEKPSLKYSDVLLQLFALSKL